MLYGMQIVVRIPDELVDEVDALVGKGRTASRSDAVRTALAEYVDRARRASTAEAIVAGYTKKPQTPVDSLWADGDTDRMIADEPW